MTSLSARRLTFTVLILVVAAVLAVFWLAPSAGASGQAARASGASAQTAAAGRPSPVRLRVRKVKAPRALPRTGEERRGKPRRFGTTEG